MSQTTTTDGPELQAEALEMACRIGTLQADLDRLRAAAMKLNGFFVETRLGDGRQNAKIKMEHFAELRDLLGLKPA